MDARKISSYKIATTYIGTVVGAGFASGQELLQFFVVFGYKGLIGLIFVTFLFIFFGYKIMSCGRLLNSQSHEVIIQYTCGKFLGSLLDFVIVFFLFGSLTAMIAGTGALMHQLFHISSLWGNLLMTLLTIITVLTGIRGIISSISFIVPFLLIATIGICIASLVIFPSQLVMTTDINVPASQLMHTWWWSALLYTSYNILLSFAILGPLGAHAKDDRSIRKGALLGGLGLGICAIFIFLTLFQNMSQVTALEIPMFYIAGQLSKTTLIIYFAVLVAAIYSTAVGSLYGFVARMTSNDPKHQKLMIFALGFFALLASQLGFTTLVKYLYPIIGYSGLVLLISLPFTKSKTKKVKS